MRIAQVTDTHADTTGTASALAAIRSIRDVDLVVHTGDISQDTFSDSISYADMLKPFAICIGNHDMLLSKGAISTGYRWDLQPTQEEAYQKYFRDNSTGITIEHGTTYWYKDLKDCRVIGIDYTARNDAYYNEWYWLERLLTECLSGNVPVFLCSHQICEYAVLQETCDFTYDTYFYDWTMYAHDVGFSVYPFMNKSYELVTEYAERGLKVICWIFGHEHADGAFISGNKKNRFPMVCCGSSVHDQYNDVYRSHTSNYVTDAVINLYEWSTGTQSLCITRIGPTACSTGRLRNMIAFNYDTDTFISREARG